MKVAALRNVVLRISLIALLEASDLLRTRLARPYDLVVANEAVRLCVLLQLRVGKDS